MSGPADLQTGAPPTMAGPRITPSPKPRFRGRIHQVAFIVSIPAALVLVAAGRTASSRLSGAVYGIGLTAMLGTSASYHRYPWSDRAHGRMRRLDHSMIFLLIAGTYTPFSVLALHGATQAAILAIVWSGAAVGIALTHVPRHGLQAVTGVLYLALGWVAVIAAPQFVTGPPVAVTALLLAGGVLYTVGAAVLARRRPDPSPHVFGYHEIWHVFVTTGALCHYVAILILVLTAG